MWASGQTPQMRVVMRGISSTGRPSQNFSKPAQLGHLEEAVADLAPLVQEDVDLSVPLEAGDRVDRDVASRHVPHPLPSARPPLRWLEDRLKR